MVKISCPDCDTPNDIPQHYVGKDVRCRNCSSSFTASNASTDSIVFSCQSCGQSIEAPSDYSGQLADCPACGNAVEIPPRKIAPQRSVAPKEPQRPETKRSKEELGTSPAANANKQKIGLIGSGFLLVGVFCPIVSLPIVGQMNYFQNGKGDGTIILVLAVGSAILCLARRFPLLWITGGGSLALLTYTFFKFQSGISEMKRKMQSDLSDNIFSGLAEIAVESVQLQWGFAILVIGAVLIVSAAAMPTHPRDGK